jgi:gliding motility-associated-like protein
LLNVSHPSIRSYQWQDGSRQPGYTVRQPGQYAVTVQGHNGCASTASVRVLHQALPAFSLGQDTSLCEEQSLSYRFNLPQATYRWNNGSQAPQQSIHAAGLYWLEVMQNNCTLRDSIIVQYRSLPVIHLGNDTSLCEGTQKILDASFPLATYQWQDGSSASQLSVNNPGLYHVNIQRDGCLFRDSIRIEYLSKPRIILGGDTTICTGQELVLNPKVNQASLVWGDGSTGTMLRVTNPGMYTVTATNKCGSSSGQIQLTRGVCKLYMPNAFTPNGDGINDLFRVKYPGFIKTFHMAIYNRWGAIVFQTENPLDGWNGRYRNTDQPAGNYIWQISLTTLEGEKEQARGNVILLR